MQNAQYKSYQPVDQRFLLFLPHVLTVPLRRNGRIF
jgi:hypothetical protein